ncbi:MAG TPA: universal stress protein [Candidatus Limnocylindria bacterium]|nr:universal stress protein [Candidatus Limnocylindria bacterium]
MSHYRVLIPTLAPAQAGKLLRLATSFTAAPESGGTLLGIIEVPPDHSLARPPVPGEAYRTLLAQTTRIATRAAPPLAPLVRIAHVAAQGIRESALETGSNLLLLESGARDDGLWTNALEDLLYDPPCDVALLRTEAAAPPITSILLAVRGGPSAELAVQLARSIRASTGATLTLLHIFDPRQSPEERAREEQTFASLTAQVNGPVIELKGSSTNVRQAIVKEAQQHQLLILGATRSLMHRPMVLGAPLQRMLRRLPGTVMIVKKAGVPTPRPAPARTETRAAITEQVDRWLTENTFDSREFDDLQRLVDRKRRQDLTISLAIPAMPGATGLSATLRSLKLALMGRTPLLDEIVVIEIGGSAASERAARVAGVTVVRPADVLSRYGSFPGSGEAQWKSLHVLKGDLICWIDPAGPPPQPRLVTGLLGPLLTDPDIAYVTAFSRRPPTAAPDPLTDFALRPLLNLLFPALSGLIDPLSPDHAGRRAVLESVPFFTGHGLALGLLLAIASAHGPRALAQVEVGPRARREPADRQAMAFAQLQVCLKYLGDRHRVQLVDQVNRTIKQIQYEDERYWIAQTELEDTERPPMVTVPEYFLSRNPGARPEPV